METLRALLVAGEPAARLDVHLLLRRLPNMQIVGECQDADELLAALGELDPDLVLIDASRVPELLESLPRNGEQRRRGERGEADDEADEDEEECPERVRFAVKKPHGRITFVSVEELLWVEAARDYVRLHTAESSHLMRQTMTAIECQLDPDLFVRIHRSTIVRVDAVNEIKYEPDGRCHVLLADGNERVASRAGRKRLQEAIGFSI